ncbi:MAG: ABC transporter ATP-binding protein/permease [Sphingomonadales bacterium]
MQSDPNPTSTASTEGISGWIAFLRSFWAFAGGWWSSRERWKAITMIAGLVVLTIMQVGVAVALNLWNLRFFDALEQKALRSFFILIGVFIVIILANVGVTIAHLQVKRRLQVNWRRWLTRRVMQDWIAAGRHHTLSYASGRHDNPDGRIAEDIRIATEYAVDIGHSGLYSTILLVSFVNILWAVSGSVSVLGIPIPGHLVWIAIAYTVVATWIALKLGRPMTRAANRRQASEADFRFGLARARTHSLGIALMQGEPDERRRSFRLFHKVFRAWNRQTAALRRFFYYMATWPLLNQIFPVLIAAPRYIMGSISLGTLMQAAQAFGQVVSALSWPVDNLAKAAEWRASAERARQLHDALAQLRRNRGIAGHLAPAVSKAETLEFRKLVLTNGQGQPLAAPVDLVMLPGDQASVSGDPALTGTLFHAAAGLWPWGEGRILLPSSGAVHFMPERPYVPLGPLHDALCYPEARHVCGVVAVIEALTRAGLVTWADDLERSAAWDEVMPLADQQRLGFARLLLHRPAWVVMHGATSALDAEAEQDMMRLIHEARADTSVLVIGDRPALGPSNKSIRLERV